MSLPPAVKDTTEHPPKNAVASPVNKANKDADIDRKMRLYGVVEAFRQGRMPDNAQIDRTLKFVLEHSPVDEAKLSSDGRKLVQDSRDVIETARLIVQKKNSDEIFQNFMWGTRDVDLAAAKKDPNEVIPVDAEKLQQDKQQAAKHLRTLVNLLATNSEARKLLTDFSILGRDILARATVHVADMIRPGDEKLRQVDQSAPAHQFRTEGGQIARPSETPVAETTIPGVNGAVLLDHEGGVQVNVDGQQLSPDQARERAAKAAGTRASEAADQAGPAMDNAAAETSRTIEQVQRGEADIEARKSGFMTRLAGFRVIIECQRHDDYQESIRWLIAFVEEYAAHGRSVAGHGKDTHGKLTNDVNLQASWTQLRTLLERFANNRSMDLIFQAINQLIDDVRQDQEFREWWKRVDAYTRKVLLEPGFVLEPQCNNEGREVREDGRKFYDDRYREHFDRLFGTVGEWFKAMGDDPLNKRLGDDLARLTRDLLFDSNGDLQFKSDLWLDIRKVILPTLVEQVGYIPIPRIEYTDEALDLVVENLTLQGRNIFPNIISMETHNFVKFSPYSTIQDQNHHEFILTLGQIQADMRDVAFYFHRKTGIPKIKDSGLADVLLGGNGLTATVHLSSSDHDRSSVFKVKKVDVKVDAIKFSIRDSKHDILYKTIRPLASGLIKRQIQKAARDAITTGFEYIDGQLVGVRDRYAQARDAGEGVARTEALRAAFRREAKEADSSAHSIESTASRRASTFRMVAKRNSAIVQGGHDAGLSVKAQERADIAAQGETWHSEAFAIV
ncbi:hypothetical protein K488DRAFT_90191 [Vararia minispora EC-137]|uniref:Uncharacterized protein n=1 Tax=Vararia minispora EC-137 TaxID=1314806 RepID=A0ACB8Q878_9AGAM|nr:hypothetical protein K488DRAFT_90191 [Vararia minispora EC-137]